jgi:hypothetical protein
MISVTVLSSEIGTEIECCRYSKLSYNKGSILKVQSYSLERAWHFWPYSTRRLQELLKVVRCLKYKQWYAETEG